VLRLSQSSSTVSIDNSNGPAEPLAFYGQTNSELTDSSL